MRTPIRAFAVWTALTASACARSSGTPADAGADVSPPAPAPMPRVLLEAGASRAQHLILPCRAIAVQGAPTLATDAGAHPLATSDLAGGWITLGAGDTVTAKLPRSGREVSFTGPGLVEPCVAPDEAWVSRGRFQGGRGSGEAPGAEEWVVTPSAVVRYGAATVEVLVEGSVVTVSLKGGSATILAEGSAKWEPLDTSSPRVVKGAPLTRAGSTAATDRCTKASDAAKALEDALLAPGATSGPTFGETAMHATEARQLARATCASAKLRQLASP